MKLLALVPMVLRSLPLWRVLWLPPPLASLPAQTPLPRAPRLQWRVRPPLLLLVLLRRVMQALPEAESLMQPAAEQWCQGSSQVAGCFVWHPS